MLRDPTPLFLPTEFNSSRKDYVPREPGGAFAGFSPKLTFGEAELDLHLPAAGGGACVTGGRALGGAARGAFPRV